jgi:hypothetical protein
MSHKFSTSVLAILLAGAALWPSAKAEDRKKEATVVFTAPVEVPGRILPPGKYTFTIAGSQSDRTTVQIFTEDRSELVATISAIPAYRLEPTDETMMTFEERSTGSPQALRRWFCPGEVGGVALVYPEDQR